MDCFARFASFRGCLTVLICCWGLALTGCATLSQWQDSRWAADYDTAELLARRSDRPMLIYYKDPTPGNSDTMKPVLDSPEIESRTSDYVRCMLFKSYEPDRRYVGQFGVTRAPALIVLHRDGTYHARTGMMPASDVARFLTDASPPGETPTWNKYIPREVRYQWQPESTAAVVQSVRSGKPRLVVFYRMMSGDWRRISKLLSRQEVAGRFADMVHCRVSTRNPWAEAYITQFGSLKLPAVVVAHSNGTFHVLERPTSSEALVRFADRCNRAMRSPAEESVTSTVGR